MREEFEKLPKVARSGKVRTVYGHGVSDAPTSANGIHLPEYKIWSSMIRRCYSKKYQEAAKTYKQCSVSSDFLYFSKFKEWCIDQIGFCSDGFELDKDLIKKGNLVYSADTCCFLPREINSGLILQKNRRSRLPIGVSVHNKTGLFVARMNVKCVDVRLGYFKSVDDAFFAYKQAKETYMRSLATKWKGCISNDAYLSLKSYTVDIDD